MTDPTPDDDPGTATVVNCGIAGGVVHLDGATAGDIAAAVEQTGQQNSTAVQQQQVLWQEQRDAQVAATAKAARDAEALRVAAVALLQELHQQLGANDASSAVVTLAKLLGVPIDKDSVS